METAEEYQVETVTGWPPEIAKDASAGMVEIGKVAKADHNKHGRYDYAGIDSFLQAVQPVAAKHGLLFEMDETKVETFDRTSVDGYGKEKTTTWLWLTWAIRIVHKSGHCTQPVKRTVFVPLTGAQAFGSAQSYALKQYLRSLFLIPTGEPDADSEAPQEASRPARRPPPDHVEYRPRKPAPEADPARQGPLDEPKFTDPHPTPPLEPAKKAPPKTDWFAVVKEIHSAALNCNSTGELKLLKSTNANRIQDLKDFAPDEYKRLAEALTERYKNVEAFTARAAAQQSGGANGEA